MRPGRSQKRRSTIWTSSSLASESTSLGVVVMWLPFPLRARIYPGDAQPALRHRSVQGPPEGEGRLESGVVAQAGGGLVHHVVGGQEPRSLRKSMLVEAPCSFVHHIVTLEERDPSA